MRHAPKVETDYDAALTYHGPLDGITWNTWTCATPAQGPILENQGGGDACYSSGQTNAVTNYTGSYGKVIAQREYDWGPAPAGGPLLRQTKTAYQWQVNSAYLQANLMDLPASVQVLDGSGNQVSLTTYSYDEYPLDTSNSTQHNPNPVNGAFRGNLTSTHHWLNGSTTSTANCPVAVSNGFVVTYTQYNDTGTVAGTTDACGVQANDPHHTTTHTYDPTYAGAYPTQSCNTLGQCVSATYDFNTGLITSFTDPNQQTSNFSYDPQWRLTQVLAPTNPVTGLRPETDFDYSVVNQMKRTKRQTATASIVDYVYFDGLGRTKQTRLVDPSAGGDDFVDTTYDPLGRVGTVSNPHRAVGGSTDGITTTFYDPLGRVTQVNEQDGSVVRTDYSRLPAVTVTDEAGKARKSQTDAVGRLIRVWEDPNGLNYETDYQYDTLNNLLRVDQKGSAASDGTQWRTRLFTYDSLSRLLTAYNPESGTISYAYDADSNMVTKTAPAPNQTGSATVTTTYGYDPLHRLTSKTYSDGATPSANFAYDGAGWWGITQTNTVGRMQEAWLGQCCGAVIFGYDAMGRVVLNNQCLPDYCPNGGVPLSYTYDLAGDMTSYTNGAGVTLSQGFDSTGRIAQLTSSLSDAQHPATLATVDASVGYYPSGELRKVTFGNGVTETAAYNNRLQPCRLNVNQSGGALESCGDAVIPGLGDFTYGYDTGTADNESVVSFSATGTQNFNRSYTYDSLNRLLSMLAQGDSCTGLSWTYDAWANRTDQTVTGGSCYAFHQPVNAQNWLAAAPYQYDAAGNMTNDGNHSYTYDAENRLIKVDGGATASYIYDALGRRIRKSSGSGWTDYVYDASGVVVTEYINGIGNCPWPCWQATYISVGGKLAAEYKDGTTYFFHQDHLGSTRLLTRQDQSLADSIDYLPYGEQIAGGTDTTHKFTGKERDSESGLDYFGARYYSNGLGRFITSDWSVAPVPVPYADLTDPQTFNQYGYVRNLPTTRFDVDGHCDWCKKALESLAIGADKGLRMLDTKFGGPAYGEAVGTMDIAGNETFLAHPANTLEQIGFQGTQAAVTTILAASLAAAAEGEVGAATKLTKAEQLVVNAGKGAAWEGKVGAALSATDPATAQQVTLETQNGVRTRIDFVSRDTNGNVVLTEAKGSATARLTPNQTAAHPEIANTGATVVGQGKPAYPGGTQIPPTKVNVVRPQQQQ